MQKMNIITVLIYFYLEIITTTTNIITNSVFDLKTEFYRKKTGILAVEWLVTKETIVKVGCYTCETDAPRFWEENIKKII